MAMKDITDKQVCEAYLAARLDSERFPYDYLMDATGQPFKVCYRCMERACYRGLVEYGVSLRTGWLTDEGFEVAGIMPFAWSEGKDFLPEPFRLQVFDPAQERMEKLVVELIVQRMVQEVEDAIIHGDGSGENTGGLSGLFTKSR